MDQFNHFLTEATGPVLNANGKRAAGRRQPRSAPAAKRGRTRGQPSAVPVLVNPTAPATDTVTGPGISHTVGSIPALRVPQPLQRLGSLTRRPHKEGESSAVNASDVWYNLYYLEEGQDSEPAARPENQPRRHTNPLGDKPCRFSRVACRFCTECVVRLSRW